MLFEFHGKIYEIPSFFLYFLGILLFFGFGFLSYKGILLISQHAVFAFPTALSSSEDLSPSSPSSTQSSSSLSSSSPLPKEVKQVLAQQPDKVPSPYEICYFNGRGRVAKKIGKHFDCRKTEDLKIITLQTMTVYCCVAP